MRVADIARGMLTGYGLRLLQMLVTLLVVPFLLRDDVLGIENYGRVFSILGVLSLISLLTDGLKSSFSRSISQSLSVEERSTGRTIGSSVKLMTILCLAVGGGLALVHVELLQLLGIPDGVDFRSGFLLAVLAVVGENLLFIVSSLLTARGRMDVLNTVLAFEVFLRNAAFVAWFSLHGGSMTSYFAIYAGGILLRTFSLLGFSLRAWPDDFAGFWSGKLSDSKQAIRYSFSLSMVSVNYFVFQRLSIPLTARFIGAAEAGLLAIALNTIANNLSQVLFNVARPLLIPVASRIRFDRISDSRARLLLNVDGLYALLVASVTVPIIACMPTLVGVWLGPDRIELILPAQILVAGALVQVGFNIRRALLVGQGMAGMIARVSIACGLLGLVGLGWALVMDRSWTSVAMVIALVGATSSAIGAGLGFDSTGLIPESRRRKTGLRILATMGIGIVTGAVASRFAPLELQPIAVIPPAASIAVVLIASHLLLVKIGEARGTISTLRDGAHRSIVDDGTDPDLP